MGQGEQDACRGRRLEGGEWGPGDVAQRNQPKPASVQPAAGGAQPVPAGKYACYTFDNGQLNDAYTDVVIQPGGRYSVGTSSGTYAIAAGGAMTFTGTMANAKGRFAIKSSGKPQIDLVFDGDARASMVCSRG